MTSPSATSLRKKPFDLMGDLNPSTVNVQKIDLKQFGNTLSEKKQGDEFKLTRFNIPEEERVMSQ